MTLRPALALFLLPISVLTACAAPVEPEALRIEVLDRHPHDPGAFTQGLLWNGSTLYESTGLYGRSSLREVNLATGAVLRSRAMDATIFAEGLSLFGGHLTQLTWQNHMAFVYDAATFEMLDLHSVTGEGWGLCQDGSRLIMSDGSSTLTFRDPESFEVLSSLRVTVRGSGQDRLNELEFVDGFIYANIWQEDRILKIDPATGIAVGEIDASGLLTTEEAEEADVLNGIAYLPESGRFLITGKLWPWLFEVQFVPASEASGLVLGAETASPEAP